MSVFLRINHRRPRTYNKEVYDYLIITAQLITSQSKSLYTLWSLRAGDQMPLEDPTSALQITQDLKLTTI